MDTPSFKEDHISQIPALQLLQKLGYQYLDPEEALEFRGNKSSNVILEKILRYQLKERNKKAAITVMRPTTSFSRGK